MNNSTQGLNKTRSKWMQSLRTAFKGSFDLGDRLFDELEEALILADVSVNAATYLVERLKSRVERTHANSEAEVISCLQDEIGELLLQVETSWQHQIRPYVVVAVGVNGVGKTTTLAKIGNKLKHDGKRVLFAAADTYRAAAVEQLQQWGNKLSIDVVAPQNHGDAAAVAHDAWQSAVAQKMDYLLIDTAGRLHTQDNLMQQLQKLLRVLTKLDAECPHEVMQVVDGTTGQNMLHQIEQFKALVNVSSLSITKLDGSAKGGALISVAEKYHLPVRFVGVGEGSSDLVTFRAKEFAQSLIPAIDQG